MNEKNPNKMYARELLKASEKMPNKFIAREKPTVKDE